ncbi:Protein of unknown function [Caloramator quimbayensis]|uniref:DUF3791 domain-containing protein n=1 Tax=Caloramator quimbayensis TaxID=1147123 RepID=A0A1T4YJ47_9CLOT|nr:DUF3791 domain-containing protein [Caloramator quimbayensis]SKB01291.1 Protein of unknown function [Caloramator quimbayensis]
MGRSMEDRVISIQTQVIEAYRRKHSLSAEEIAEVISKYNLSKFIQDNYELLHLTGVDGIVEEIEVYIAECEGGK